MPLARRNFVVDSSAGRDDARSAPLTIAASEMPRYFVASYRLPQITFDRSGRNIAPKERNA